MKPRIPDQGLHPLRPPFATRGKPSWSRHASAFSSAAPASPSKYRLWGRLAGVIVAAAGIGAYLRSQQDTRPSTLNPLTFTKYTLIAKDPVSSTGSIFTFKPPKPEGNEDVYKEAWRKGVWSVMFKQPQLQIGRDYTPLPVTTTTKPEDKEKEDGNELRFFIRKDPFGEVSRYLHGLTLGSVVEMRGPKMECRIPSRTREILFIAGGTGVAPALQAGHTLLRRTSDSHKPRIHILWANRRREDCAGAQNDTNAKSRSWFYGLLRRSPAVHPEPTVQRDTTSQSLMVRELEALKSQYPGQVTVDYFVDEENTFIKKQDILDFTNSTRPSKGSSENKMILVSGPDGFISYMAGPKLWAQGMQVQGPVRGIIGEHGLNDWDKWKLS